MADKIDDAKFESMDSMERMQYISELSEDEQKEFFDGLSEKDKVAWYNPDMTEEEVIQYLKETNPDALLQEEKMASDEDIQDMYMNDDAGDYTDDEEDSNTSAATDEENDEDFEDDGSSKSSIRKRYEKFKTEDQFIDEAAKQYEQLDKIRQDLEKVNGWIADEKAILKKDRKNTFAQNALDGHQEQVVDLQHQMSQVYNEAALLQTIYDSKFPESNKLSVANSPNGKNKEMSQDDIHAMAESINNGNGQNNKQKSGQVVSDPNFISGGKKYGANATGAFDVESYNRFANSFGDRAAAELNDISEKYQAIAQVALNSYSKFDEMFHSVGLDLDRLQGAPIATGSARLNRLHRQRVKLERTKGQVLDTYSDLKNPLLQQALGAVEATSVLIGETKKYTDLMEADPFLRHLEEEGAAKGIKVRLLDFAKDVYPKDATKGAEKIEKELTNPTHDANIEKDDSQKGQTSRFRQFLDQIKSRFSGQGAAGVDGEEVQGNNAQETEKDEESKDATTTEENVNSDNKKEDENPGSNNETPDETFDSEDGGYSDDFDDDFVDFGDEYEEFSEESGDEKSDGNPDEKTDEESNDEKSDENPDNKADEESSDEKSDENPDGKTDEESSDERSDDESENKEAFGEQPSNEESSDKTSDDEFGDKPGEENFDDNAKKIHTSYNGMMLRNQHIARRDGEFESQEVALDALDEQLDYLIDSARVRYKEASAGSSNEKEAKQLKEEIKILTDVFGKDILEGEATQDVSKTLRPSKLVDLLDINQQLRSELTKDPEYKLDIDIKLNKDGKELAGNTNEFKKALGIEDVKASEDVESAKEARMSKLAQDARYQKVLSYARNAKGQDGHDGKNGPNGPV